MIVITTIFWIIVGVMVLYLTIFVIAFIYNGYLLATGKMSREELANKVAYNKYIKEKKLKKKPKKRYTSSLPPPF
ncbi:MAG: hypothetical protein J6L02_07300 [Bacteroidales bacterium]|nr:hypothetical protein [Bacteroidales bacterium]